MTRQGPWPLPSGFPPARPCLFPSCPVSASAPGACTDLTGEPGVRTRSQSAGGLRAGGNDLDAVAERDPILDLPRRRQCKDPAFASSGFHLVLSGEAWLITPDGPCRRLAPGDVVFSPAGGEHGLSHAPATLHQLPTAVAKQDFRSRPAPTSSFSAVLTGSTTARSPSTCVLFPT